MKLPFGLGKNSPDSEPGRVDPNADPTQAAGADKATTRLPAGDGNTATQAPSPGERAAPQAVGAPKSKSRWPLGKEADKSAATNAGDAPKVGGADKETPIAERPVSLDGSPAGTESTSTGGATPSGAGSANTGGSVAGASAAQDASAVSADSSTAAIPVGEMPRSQRTETQNTGDASDSGANSGGKSGKAGAAAAAGAAGAGGAGIGALIGSKAGRGDNGADPDARTQAFSQPQNANHSQTQAVPVAGEAQAGMTPDNADNQTTAFPTAGYNYADFDHNTQAYDYDGADGEVQPAAVAPAAKPVRGTADFGLFILRIVVAALLGLHSLRIVFGMFGGPGFDGMTEVFSSAGFEQAKALAYGFGIIELVAAVILLLGIITPIGATILLALVGLSAALALSAAGGTTILGGSDLSGAPGGGLELHILYAAALLTILFAGGGRWGLDAGRKWASAPKWSGFLGIIVAVAAVAVVWYALNGSNPLSS